MDRLQVKAFVRNTKGKGAARKIRAQGNVPAVVYGVGLDPLLLTVNLHEFDKALKDIEGTSVLIDLDIDGKKTLAVMLRDFQVDILSRQFRHLDFQKVDLKKLIKVEVPIHLVGTPPGVKEGGILEHVRRTLEIRCLPTNIPQAIDADVSSLNIGDTVHIHDLKLPEGVEVAFASDVTIAAVVAPAAEKEEPVPGEGGPAEPEVIGEKKAEGGEGEAKEEEKK